MLPASMHIYASNEHVPKIERSIRTIKQRAHRMCHSIPYNRYTQLMIRSLVCIVVQWLNAFPSAVGVLGDYSPVSIFEGKFNPYFNRQRFHFESYAHAYHRTNV